MSPKGNFYVVISGRNTIKPGQHLTQSPSLNNVFSNDTQHQIEATQPIMWVCVPSLKIALDYTLRTSFVNYKKARSENERFLFAWGL